MRDSGDCLNTWRANGAATIASVVVSSVAFTCSTVLDMFRRPPSAPLPSPPRSFLEPERTPAVYRQPPTAPDLEIAGRSWVSSCPSTETGGVHASGRGHSLTLLSARHAAAGPTARPAPRAVGAVSGASLRVVLRSASSLRYRRGEHVLALQQVLAHAYAWGDGQIAAAGDRRPLLRVGSRGRARGAVHGGC